jgi:hypothetical protein
MKQSTDAHPTAQELISRVNRGFRNVGSPGARRAGLPPPGRATTAHKNYEDDTCMEKME